MQAMPGNYGPPPVAPTADIEDRKAALFDIAYLVVSINLYIASFFMWPIGVVTGLFLLIGGSHPKTKRVGKICLICAGIGLVLSILYLIVMFVFMGAAAAAAS